MKQIYELHADVCKTLANPKRLEIINTLGAKELSFGDILDVLKIKKANLSQHLGLMRAKGIVKTRRDGVSIYYRIVNPKVIKACNIMREVLLEQLSESNKLIGKIK
ncbi:transcriptional regulator [candidate division WOR-1 bacterium RIFOXYA12_FULL_52_29]|uniref:Transcriptional regulator n=1 Tax=candidate division WOR-1 bacterium RIFOXYC12_FULL_54_18 TaxID=1802584 RepID=A0A1F4T7X3_UNCSA|nr:MAG: transcriptional regulator [candidate division WOR-1 bacterium RIFOXYA2_FULL_51_19]OGC18435.1 MAG: transcriptional regulator [candidate division WOR-1 bacterium RIFOXYA12_FULL_52_29]OGC27289.1 MAG: transcriptional regulator [candidate division WOR-1 bacterium RIFOXYB2_FULL_45_9]OGC28852.1 MAG: transcriptional regulator [candidate division WOR-1 bacterium RIFOXYC12_FULL_54_18]OGC30639.1 MAG: transcriptional regulator [candidate division WOR-1 bacterium RIFOXYB12_FULL_52_16]